MVLIKLNKLTDKRGNFTLKDHGYFEKLYKYKKTDLRRTIT